MGSGDHFSQADVPPTGHAPCSPTAGSPTSLMTPIRHLFPSHLINGTLSTLVFLTPKSCGQRQHAPWRSRVWTRSSVSIHQAACGIVRRQTRRTGRRLRKRPDAFPIDHAAQLGESERTSSRNTHTNTHKHIYTHHKAGGRARVLPRCYCCFLQISSALSPQTFPSDLRWHFSEHFMMQQDFKERPKKMRYGYSGTGTTPSRPTGPAAA